MGLFYWYLLIIAMVAAYAERVEAFRRLYRALKPEFPRG